MSQVTLAEVADGFGDTTWLLEATLLAGTVADEPWGGSDELSLSDEELIRDSNVEISWSRFNPELLPGGNHVV